MISVSVPAGRCTGLIVLNIILLYCSGSDCNPLIIWNHTWSLVVLRHTDSSSNPFIMLWHCFGAISARCTSRLRLTRRDRVAPWATYLESFRTSRFHQHRWLYWQWCLNSACRMGYLAAGTSSPSRCAPAVGFHGAPTTAVNTSQTERSVSDHTRRSADVHLVGFQPQSDIHDTEKHRVQLVRSASYSVQRKVEHALTENGRCPPVAAKFKQ